MKLKTLILCGGLALGSNNAFAEGIKKLPCPQNSHVVDTLNIITNETKSKIANSIQKVDNSEIKHQIVAITLDNIEDYGFSSMSELGANIINTCGIGYRGANTGMVLLYANHADSKYFIATANGVSGYISDSIAKRILEHSKEECEKADTNCRFISITQGLTNKILKHTQAPEVKKEIHQQVEHFDTQKKEEMSEETKGKIATGLLIGGIIGGIGFVGYTIQKGMRMRRLRKKLFGLENTLEKEKNNFPDWFQNAYILPIFKKINAYKKETGLETLENNIADIQNKISQLGDTYNDILADVQNQEKNIHTIIKDIAPLESSLTKESFIFAKQNIGLPNTNGTPLETLEIYKSIAQKGNTYLKYLKNIIPLYISYKSVPLLLETELKNIKKHKEIYRDIFGDDTLCSRSNELITYGETQIGSFNNSYNQKNIDSLEKIVGKISTIKNDVENTINSMKGKILWYNNLPAQIKEYQGKIKQFSDKNEYRNNAQKYYQETGKRNFNNFDMGNKLNEVNNTLKTIEDNYSKKQNLNSIDSLFAHIEENISTIVTYIGLGTIVAQIIAERIAEEARRRREEERRRRREEEEEEERRRRRDEDNSSSSRSSSSSSDSWSSGGGSGGDGGGAGSD